MLGSVFLIAALATGVAASATVDVSLAEKARKAIYGPDSRNDESATTAYWRGIGASTVVLTRPANVRGGRWASCGPLSSSYPCANGNQRFGDQATCGFCSGTLIGPNLIATAGHCITASTCSNTNVVFGATSDTMVGGRAIPSNTIFSCTRVVISVNSGGTLDYGVFEINANVPSSVAIPAIVGNTEMPVGTGLMMIGHPSGLPRKYAGDAQIQNVLGSGARELRYETNLDAFGGNSGSGVFTSGSTAGSTCVAQGVMVGILVKGATDYDSAGCVSTYAQSGRGETMSGVLTLMAFITRMAQSTRVTTCGVESAPPLVTRSPGFATPTPPPTMSLIQIVVAAATVSCGATLTGDTRNGVAILGNNAKDVLYKFRVQVTTQVTFATCGSAFDTALRLYTTAGVIAGSDALAYNDDTSVCSGSTTHSLITLLVQPSTQYIVVVEGFGSSAGAFQLAMTCTARGGTVPPTTVSPTTVAPTTSTPTTSNPTTANTPVTAPPSGPASMSPSPAGASLADIIAAAPAITCNSVATGSTIGGTTLVGNPSPETFFRLTLTEEVLSNISTCRSSFDTYLRLYNAVTLAAGGEPITTNDDHGGGSCTDPRASVMTGTLAAGVYIIVVEGFAGMSGDYKLEVSCGSGSDITLAGALQQSESLQCGTSATPTVVSGNTANGEPLIGYRARDVLYRFTLTAPKEVTLSTCGSSFDTYLQLFEEATILAGGAAIYVNDDGATGNGGCARLLDVYGIHSHIRRVLTPGSYVVVVEGYQEAMGPYELSFECADSVSVASAVSAAQPLTCGSTLSGTTADGVSLLGNDAADLFFSVDVPRSMDLWISTCGSTFDTYLRLFNRSTLLTIPGGSFGLDSGGLRSDDATCGSAVTLQSVIEVDDAPVGQYIVVVEGFARSEGAYQLSLECPTPTITATATTAAAATTRPGATAAEVRAACTSSTATAVTQSCFDTIGEYGFGAINSSVVSAACPGGLDYNGIADVTEACAAAVLPHFNSLATSRLDAAVSACAGATPTLISDACFAAIGDVVPSSVTDVACPENPDTRAQVSETCAAAVLAFLASAATTTVDPSSNSSSTNDDDDNTGVIIGVIVALLVCIAIGVLIVVMMKKNEKEPEMVISNTHAPGPVPGMGSARGGIENPMYTAAP